MNREITKRGLMVQYHFADRFGALVTKISEIEPFLLDTPSEAFVEMAQILGARMLVGSGRVESLVFERIIERCIFAQAKTFIDMAIDEIRSRHAYREERGGWRNDSDVKECRGGLRDLEMIMLMWKVHDRLRDPIGDSFWSVLMERHPEHEPVFRDFRRANAFLNRFRDIYRLTVAPVNRLRREDFDRPASIMIKDSDAAESPAEQLQASFLWHRERVATHIDGMLDLLADGVR
jgi:UTP:GlnB (protein PII) uridylyltransferase